MSMLNKIRVLPDQYIFNQGETGEAAYLIASGSFIVEIDQKNIGKLSEGEIFGELSLILGEPRKASVKAVVPSEIVEIKPAALKELLLSSSLDLHKTIKQISKELAKSSEHELPISLEELKVLLKDQPTVISSLALQLHHRLSGMIF